MLKAAMALAFAIGLIGQPTGVDVDAVLERLDGYLETYESELGALIADEDFRQEIPALPGNGPRPQQRRLESEVAFLRLPGGAEWFGFRRAKLVDGKPVGDFSQSLSNLLSIGSTDTLAQAQLLVAQSSEHNLGLPRTINMPTLPLELLSGRYRHRFEVTPAGTGKVRGRPVNLVDFSELGEVPIIYSGGQELQSHMRAWIDAATGAVWRAEVVMRGQDKGRKASKIRVEFALEPKLQVIVPVEMREDFGVANVLYGGSGVAKYSNYRRFQTSARIVPPPP
jgi:hypothetical protein